MWQRGEEILLFFRIIRHSGWGVQLYSMGASLHHDGPDFCRITAAMVASTDRNRWFAWLISVASPLRWWQRRTEIGGSLGCLTSLLLKFFESGAGHFFIITLPSHPHRLPPSAPTLPPIPDSTTFAFPHVIFSRASLHSGGSIVLYLWAWDLTKLEVE